MLRIDRLTYRIAGRTLLDGTSATIPAGHRVGLVGRNGAGKSTLLKLVLGELAPDGGEIGLERGARIGTVAQEAPSGPISPLAVVLAGDTEREALLTEAETAQDGNRLAEIHERLNAIGAHAGPARAGRILAGLGFDEAAQAQPMSSFSGGWRMRVALAAILFAQPDVLLLDEPTNYLDLEGTLWLEDFLGRYPHTLIIVSHDRDLLNSAVDAILHLDGGQLTLYAGGFDRFMRTRSERLAHLEGERTKQDTRRKHLQSFVDRFRAKASKAKQAQARLKMIEKLEPLPELPGEVTVSFRFPEPNELNPPLVTLDGAAVGYAENRPILRNLDLRIDPDDRIALLGSNGNGKSTFAKLVAGRLKPSGGAVRKASKMVPGFFAQHQADEFTPGDTPIVHLGRLLPKASPTEIRARLGGFGFGGTLAETPVERLSGGEKARLLFCLLATEKPNLLILDEPTNHLDIQSREALVEAINAYSGAVILISHDRHLIEACADRLWLVAGGTVTPFDGDMDDYRKLVLSGGSSPRKSEQSASDRREQRREAARAREQRAPLVKQLKAIEAALGKVDRDLQAIERSLADPTLYDDKVRLAELTQRRVELTRTKAAAEGEWLSLSETLDAAG